MNRLAFILCVWYCQDTVELVKPIWAVHELVRSKINTLFFLDISGRLITESPVFLVFVLFCFIFHCLFAFCLFFFFKGSRYLFFSKYCLDISWCNWNSCNLCGIHNTLFFPLLPICNTVNSIVAMHLNTQQDLGLSVLWWFYLAGQMNSTTIAL